MDRTHLAAEQAAKEEERLHLECTFRPDLPTKNAADAIAAAAAAAGATHNSVRTCSEYRVVYFNFFFFLFSSCSGFRDSHQVSLNSLFLLLG